MAITVRTGMEADFQPGKLLPGEPSASLDAGKFRVGVTGGRFLELATVEQLREVLGVSKEEYEDFQGFIDYLKENPNAYEALVEKVEKLPEKYVTLTEFERVSKAATLMDLEPGNYVLSGGVMDQCPDKPVKEGNFYECAVSVSQNGLLKQVTVNERWGGRYWYKLKNSENQAVTEWFELFPKKDLNSYTRLKEYTSWTELGLPVTADYAAIVNAMENDSVAILPVNSTDNNPNHPTEYGVLEILKTNFGPVDFTFTRPFQGSFGKWHGTYRTNLGFSGWKELAWSKNGEPINADGEYVDRIAKPIYLGNQETIDFDTITEPGIYYNHNSDKLQDETLLNFPEYTIPASNRAFVLEVYTCSNIRLQVLRCISPTYPYTWERRYQWWEGGTGKGWKEWRRVTVREDIADKTKLTQYTTWADLGLKEGEATTEEIFKAMGNRSLAVLRKTSGTAQSDLPFGWGLLIVYKWDYTKGYAQFTNYSRNADGMWIGYYDDSITDKPKFSGWKEISFDIANMTGATASANGKAGLVPAPDTASRLKFLRGDGIWATPANTTYGVVSKTANGLAPKLPNETTTTKYLRQDGTWTVPPDTKYTHPATAGNKHIPAGGKAGQFLKWSADGTAVWAADNNTTYGNMTAATASAAGKAGLVPAPGAGKQASYLRGDGTWAVPPNTTYAAATQSKNGLMSAADKKKLDGITIETGSWTPVFKGLDTAGSFTYGEDRKGTYLKIGNYVYIEAQLPVSKVNTAPKGTYVVEGMPFNSKKWAAGTINIGFSGGTEGAVNNGFRSITSGGMMYTEMRFRQMLENQIQSEFASWNVNIPVGSNFEIDFSGWYEIAEE